MSIVRKQTADGMSKAVISNRYNNLYLLGYVASAEKPVRACVQELSAPEAIRVEMCVTAAVTS